MSPFDNIFEPADVYESKEMYKKVGYSVYSWGEKAGSKTFAGTY